MYDGGKIIIGLIVFFGLLLFPVWYNAAWGDAGHAPAVEKPGTGQCVAPNMKAVHMDLLDEWRDLVVREGERYVTYPEGGIRMWPDKTPMEMSLTNTCLRCHPERERFCNECHDFLGVEPYCWDCHIENNEMEGM